MFGLVIIAATMAVAAWILYRAVIGSGFTIGDHRITAKSNRLVFWFTVLVAVLVLANGIWMLPQWFAAV